ncbi:MAG: lysophospholipid acyltransferase family protein [Pseudomonadales bacterium]
MYKLFMPLRKLVAFFLLVVWGLFMVATFYVAKFLRYSDLDKIPRLFHRGCCVIFGIRVEIHGVLCQQQPCLYVGNHISYLDVFVLGGVVPGFFIAKSDVASWPVLGRLARLQNTLFFERDRRRAVVQIAIMKDHLREGGNLILFPEGTSTYGTSVKRFKSSLFQAAEIDEHDVAIQPMTVSYTKCRGKPMTAEFRDYFAWYDIMPFFSHFLGALGAPRVTAEIYFAAPVLVTDFESRKACAAHCWSESQRMLTESLRDGDELVAEVHGKSEVAA